VVDVFLVAFQRPTHWTLHAPFQATQDLPDVAGMVVDATLLLDQLGNPRQRPETRFVPENFRASLQSLLNLGQVRRRQPSLATTPARCSQALDPFALKGSGPSTDGLPVNANLPRHRRLTPTLLEQLGGFQTPILQGFKVTLHSSWVSHRGDCIRKVSKCHYLRRTSVEEARRRFANRARNVFFLSPDPEAKLEVIHALGEEYYSFKDLTEYIDGDFIKTLQAIEAIYLALPLYRREIDQIMARLLADAEVDLGVRWD
jgi:hypothetical protein